jgi:hypothetical protein
MNNVYTAPAAPIDDSTSQDAGTAPAALTTHAHDRGGDVSGPSTSVPAATTSDPSIPSESGLTSQHKTEPTSLVAAAVPGAAGAHEEVAGQPSYVAQLGPPLGAGGSMSAPFSVVRKATCLLTLGFGFEQPEPPPEPHPGPPPLQPRRSSPRLPKGPPCPPSRPSSQRAQRLNPTTSPRSTQPHRSRASLPCLA